MVGGDCLGRRDRDWHPGISWISRQWAPDESQRQDYGLRGLRLETCVSTSSAPTELLAYICPDLLLSRLFIIARTTGRWTRPRLAPQSRRLLSGSKLVCVTPCSPSPGRSARLSSAASRQHHSLQPACTVVVARHSGARTQSSKAAANHRRSSSTSARGRIAECIPTPSTALQRQAGRMRALGRKR